MKLIELLGLVDLESELYITYGGNRNGPVDIIHGLADFKCLEWAEVECVSWSLAGIEVDVKDARI